MAELVFFHGQGKPDGRFTVQIVYDAERPANERYAGRVLDLHGAKVFQSVWVSGNTPAIDHAEKWCAGPQAAGHTHAQAPAAAEPAKEAPSPEAVPQPAGAPAPAADLESSEGAGPAGQKKRK